MRRGNRTVIEMLVVGVVASAVGIVIALVIDWFPPAASKQAGPIDTLWDVLLIVSVPIFVLVTVVVLFAVREFRMRPGQELQDGPPIHGNTRLEVLWTSVPAIIIAALVVYAYLVLRDIEKAPANAATEMHVKVTGEQFAWLFEYDADGKRASSPQLYVPQGRSVKFDIVSKDVLHDFWVPAWRMKIDAVPGITTHYRVTPTKVGEFPIVCAELCGLGHAFMRSTAHVVTPAQFTTWLQKLSGGGSSNTPSAGGGDSTATKPDGKALFASTDLGCTSCHTLADANATGTTGPNLDEALATASVADIRKDITAPDAEIASGYLAGLMPRDFGTRLSPAEVTALATYLQKVTAK